MSLYAPQFNQLILGIPEVGLQTYEYFDDAQGLRNQAKADFMASRSTQPDIAYPLLEWAPLEETVELLSLLGKVASDVDGFSDIEREAYQGTIDYRRREAEFLLMARDLNRPETPDFTNAIYNFQERNEELYGRPDQALIDATVVEIRGKIGQKGYKGYTQDIFDEVQETLTSLTSGNESEGLPRLTDDTEAFLKERIEAFFWPEHEAVARTRAIMEDEGETAFDPYRLMQVFMRGLQTRDQLDEVGVFLKSGSFLSWSQKREGVEIGRDRAVLESDGDAFGITVHEGGVHKERFINGRASSIPIFGNGLIIPAGPQVQATSLPFEEGIANMYQELANGKNEGWTMANFTYLLNTAMAYKGLTYRGIYDKNWKLRTLMMAEDGTEVTPKEMQKAQRLAYDSTLRVHRGTPIARMAVDEAVATYNKDLAYQVGRVRAIDFWNQHVGNDTMFEFLLAGKFDPTNPPHLAIAHAATGGKYVNAGR